MILPHLFYSCLNLSTVFLATADVMIIHFRKSKSYRHPKIVYHKGGLGTRSFRLAKSGENRAENPTGKWVLPPLVSWYEMTGNGLTNADMRDLMNSFSYGSAITGFKDGRFQQQIEKCTGKEVDMKLVNAYPHAIKSTKRLNVHGRYEISAHFDEKSYIIAQGDDNIVIYTNGRATWDSASNNRCDSETIVYFQGDGNLVFYCKGKGAVWALGYSGSSGPYYLMAEHGRPVVKTYKGVTVRKL
ncbi:sugar-binding protein [Chaetoceros tenuissimus]|uniref:Sugar-binding protein n=1 Tax=Chaetoceros tenuissimus TaxID=426638 RepID=A0AAD3HFY5_9STRA|nr:sugar-binding protein [Chaetoceros tenuissimus]